MEKKVIEATNIAVITDKLIWIKNYVVTNAPYLKYNLSYNFSINKLRLQILNDDKKIIIFIAFSFKIAEHIRKLNELITSEALMVIYFIEKKLMETNAVNTIVINTDNEILFHIAKKK